MDTGDWRPTVQGVAEESDMPEHVCVHTHRHTHTQSLCAQLGEGQGLGDALCVQTVLTLLRTQRAEVTPDIQEPLLCFGPCLFQPLPPSHKIGGLTPIL